ncbi:MAG TPA: Uxx-star family glutaredoxin-like (seleno)protein [Syntrophales bacterium]|nr:Uxx-star family glutaredoxin-like (seleno)protein [Syntrophales bacterium]
MRKAALFMALIITAALFMAATSTRSNATTLYGWVDDQGVSHVSENPPEGKMDVAQAVDGEAPDKGTKAEEKKEFRVRPAEVTIYTMPTCPWCHRAKAWLRDKKIRYKEVDVSTDKKGHDEMVRISGQTGVPVILVGAEVIVGFNESRLNQIFKD